MFPCFETLIKFPATLFNEVLAEYIWPREGIAKEVPKDPLKIILLLKYFFREIFGSNEVSFPIFSYLAESFKSKSLPK